MNVPCKTGSHLRPSIALCIIYMIAMKCLEELLWFWEETSCKLCPYSRVIYIPLSSMLVCYLHHSGCVWLCSLAVQLGNRFSECAERQCGCASAHLRSYSHYWRSHIAHLSWNCEEATHVQLSWLLYLCSQEYGDLGYQHTVLDLFPGQEYELWAVDHALNPETLLENDSDYIPEVLHSFTPSGFPAVHLALKISCPVMVLHNLQPCEGVCNRLRGIITCISTWILKVQLFSGMTVLVLRIKLISADLDVPFKLCQLQFLISLSFAMTINPKVRLSKSLVLIFTIQFSLMASYMLPFWEHVITHPWNVLYWKDVTDLSVTLARKVGPGVARPSKARTKNIGRKEHRESRRKHVDRSDGSGREYQRIERTHQITCRLEISVLITGLDMIGW